MPGTIGMEARLGAGIVIALLVGACNAISGADDIVLTEGEEDGNDDVTAGVGTGGTTGNGAVGAGGATNGNGAVTTGAGPANGATTGDTTTTGSGTGCEYPAGPYGVAEGQVPSPTISWQGYAEGPTSAGVTTISIADYIDCDGSKGIHAIMVETSQFG